MLVRPERRTFGHRRPKTRGLWRRDWTRLIALNRSWTTFLYRFHIPKIPDHCLRCHDSYFKLILRSHSLGWNNLYMLSKPSRPFSLQSQKTRGSRRRLTGLYSFHKMIQRVQTDQRKINGLCPFDYYGITFYRGRARVNQSYIVNGITTVVWIKVTLIVLVRCFTWQFVNRKSYLCPYLTSFTM